MQPSSDQPGESSTTSSALRRYGPIAAIVVVVAVVAALVFTSGGDDDETATDDTTDESTDSSDGASSGVEGVVSFSQAKEDDLDVTFPETCDTELGRIALPTSFATECYANVDDNGGATHTGVTADTISLVVYNAPEVDAVLDFITGPIANDDSPTQIRETVQTYIDLFNEYFQTYGRTVEAHFVEASGESTDEVAARADAKQAIDEFKPFAAIGGPPLTNAWSDEMAANGVVCMGCGLSGGQEYLADHDPFLFATGMSGLQNNLHVAQYVAARLKDGKAEYGGDDVKDEDRVFGHLYIRSTEESDKSAETLHDLLSERGVEIPDAGVVSYELDPARLPEQATSAIQKFKSAGVTTILLQGDPVGPKNFTDEATAQNYFPEWVLSGGTLQDTTVFGRVFDQEQWRHAFGITGLTARSTPDLDPGVRLHEWFTGEAPPAPDTAPILWGGPYVFFSGLQLAGPNLTPETYKAGLVTNPPDELQIFVAATSFGDHGLWDEIGIEMDYSGSDDKTEIWYDADATGSDEIDNDGTGMVRYVDGGKRLYQDQWEGTDDKLFDEEGSVTVYEELPESEKAPDYPSPAG